MEFIRSTIDSIVNFEWRQNITQVLNLALIVSSALMSWRGLMLLTGSESPVVVVLSGSMEPAFSRGDILFLNLGTSPLRNGEIVVYNIKNKDIPIVHRIIQVHERASPKGDPGSEVDILTKGDNNPMNDRVLYNRKQRWLEKQHIMGRAVAYLPHVGMVTIVMNDYPVLKYGVIGLLALFCLLGLDE